MHRNLQACVLIAILFFSNIFSLLHAKEEQEDFAKKNIAAMVEEYAITKEQVFDLMRERYPVQTQEIITELIIYQIVKLEAKVERIAFPTELLEKKASEEIQKFKLEMERNHKLSWQDYLNQIGVKEEKIYSDAIRNWRYKIALQCLIRLSEMKEVQIDARHIMVNSKEKAQAILEKLRENADFDALVKKESLSDTKSQGGRFPRLFQGDIDSSLEKVLFSLEPMKISGIVTSPWGYHILQVLKVYPPDPNATWSQQRIHILASIEKNPVNDRELKRWLEKMKKKYRIKN